MLEKCKLESCSLTLEGRSKGSSYILEYRWAECMLDLHSLIPGHMSVGCRWMGCMLELHNLTLEYILVGSKLMHCRLILERMLMGCSLTLECRYVGGVYVGD